MKLTNEITLKKELRPCIVKGMKALFHGWDQICRIVSPQPMTPYMRPHRGGEERYTLGVIELEDGTIHKEYPEEIRFVDMAVNHYFGENVTALDFEKHEGAGGNESEKIIKGLEICSSSDPSCKGCPYYEMKSPQCLHTLQKEAAELITKAIQLLPYATGGQQ